MRRAALTAGVLGLLIAAGLTALMLRQIQDATLVGRPYVASFDHPSNAVEKMMATGDGMAFAQIARDPTLSHPEAFRPPEFEAAYRAQRPLLGYLGWVVALGSPERAPIGVAAVSVLGAGFAAAMLGAMLHRRGGPAIAGALVVVLPGSIDSMQWFGADLLALGLAVAGILAWRAERTGAMVTLLAAAALARESMLLVPAGLAIWMVLERRRRPSTALLTPFVAWAGWQLIVRWRFDRWPWDAGPDRLAAPFAGIAEALPSWDPFTGYLAVAILTLGPIVAALMLRRSDHLTVIAVLVGILGVMAGPGIWDHWTSVSRVLLPGYVLAAVALATPLPRARTPQASATTTAISP